MTKFRKGIIFVAGIVAMLSLVLVAGCGTTSGSNGATSSSETSSEAEPSAEVRTIDAEIYVKDGVDSATVNKFVDEIKNIEGVVSADFQPATERKHAHIHYSVIQGTSTIAIEDMLMEMEGFSDIVLDTPSLDVVEDVSSEAAPSSASAESADVSDSSAAADTQSDSSATEQPEAQEQSGESSNASQE